MRTILIALLATVAAFGQSSAFPPASGGLQSSGTLTNGNLASYNATGQAVDSGIATSNVAKLASANTYTAGQTIIPAANTSALVISGYSVTGSGTTPAISIAGTWNTTAGPALISADLTVTASNFLGYLINLKRGGTSQFSVTEFGHIVGATYSGGNLSVNAANGTVLRTGSDYNSASFSLAAVTGTGTNANPQYYDLRGTTSNTGVRVKNTTATTGVSRFWIEEGAGQSTSEVFGVYANDASTLRWKIQNSVPVWGSASEPTCNSTNRGSVVMVQGAAGAADTFRICGKSAADTYSYAAVATF